MKKLPIVVETWSHEDKTIEILRHDYNPTFYTLRIISENSERYPVLQGAVQAAQECLTKKLHAKLYKIETDS